MFLNLLSFGFGFDIESPLPGVICLVVLLGPILLLLKDNATRWEPATWRVLTALAGSLALADEAVVAAVFRSEVIPEAERMDVPGLVAQIQKSGRRARVISDVDAIVQTVAPEMRSGDVVAILSNGGFGGIYEKLPRALQAVAEKSGKVSAKA